MSALMKTLAIENRELIEVGRGIFSTHSAMELFFNRSVKYLYLAALKDRES